MIDLAEEARENYYRAKETGLSVTGLVMWGAAAWFGILGAREGPVAAGALLLGMSLIFIFFGLWAFWQASNARNPEGK